MKITIIGATGKTGIELVKQALEYGHEVKRISFVSSCDVYEFDADHTILSITSYCITERT